MSIRQLVSLAAAVQRTGAENSSQHRSTPPVGKVRGSVISLLVTGMILVTGMNKQRFPPAPPPCQGSRPLPYHFSGGASEKSEPWAIARTRAVGTAQDGAALHSIDPGAGALPFQQIRRRRKRPATAVGSLAPLSGNPSSTRHALAPVPPHLPTPPSRRRRVRHVCLRARAGHPSAARSTTGLGRSPGRTASRDVRDRSETLPPSSKMESARG